ncbi:MAG: hypothetical protein H6502_01760 [Candidatus Woesearchaeota archaeon]|nr:MAG: hypothetical protein H6502_01760 [Candidatus Woesearchaeota archaeon]
MVQKNTLLLLVLGLLLIFPFVSAEVLFNASYETNEELVIGNQTYILQVPHNQTKVALRLDEALNGTNRSDPLIFFLDDCKVLSEDFEFCYTARTNDTARVYLRDPTPDIKVDVNVSRTVFWNDTVEVNISIMNEGDGRVKNLLFSIPIPQGLTVVSTGSCEENATHLYLRTSIAADRSDDCFATLRPTAPTGDYTLTGTYTYRHDDEFFSGTYRNSLTVKHHFAVLAIDVDPATTYGESFVVTFTFADEMPHDLTFEIPTSSVRLLASSEEFREGDSYYRNDESFMNGSTWVQTITVVPIDPLLTKFFLYITIDGDEQWYEVPVSLETVPLHVLVLINNATLANASFHEGGVYDFSLIVDNPNEYFSLEYCDFELLTTLFDLSTRWRSRNLDEDQSIFHTVLSFAHNISYGAHELRVDGSCRTEFGSFMPISFDGVFPVLPYVEPIISKELLTKETDGNIKYFVSVSVTNPLSYALSNVSVAEVLPDTLFSKGIVHASVTLGPKEKKVLYVYELLPTDEVTETSVLSLSSKLSYERGRDLHTVQKDLVVVGSELGVLPLLPVVPVQPINQTNTSITTQENLQSPLKLTYLIFLFLLLFLVGIFAYVGGRKDLFTYLEDRISLKIQRILLVRKSKAHHEEASSLVKIEHELLDEREKILKEKALLEQHVGKEKKLLPKQIHHIESDVARLSGKIKSLERKKDALHNRIASLQAKENKLVAAETALDATRTSLRERETQLEKSHQEVQSKLAKQEKLLASLDAKLQEIRTLVKNSESNYSVLKQKELAHLQEKVALYEKKQQSLKKQAVLLKSRQYDIVKEEAEISRALREL